MADLGGWGAVTPPFCHLKHKRMHALTLKHNKTAKFLPAFSAIFALKKYNSLDPPIGCIHHTPYLINALLKIENLIYFT